MSYLNIRSSPSGKRILKIALVHTIYFVGVALGVTFSLKNIVQLWTAPPIIVDKQILNNVIGFAVLITSAIIFVGYIINELLNNYMKKYNYKMSFDVDFERENVRRQILESKLFSITNSDGICEQPIKLNQINNSCREITSIMFVLLAKLINVGCFYYPVLYMNYISLLHDVSVLVPFVHWTAVASALLGSYILHKISIKPTYLISALTKIIIIMIIIIVTSFNLSINSSAYQVIVFVTYFIISFGYSFPNILCVELMNFKNIELIIAIGYGFEMIVIGVTYYYTITDPDNFLSLNCSSYVGILHHTVPFIIGLILLSFLSIFITPEFSSYSLMESKNAVKVFNYRKWWQLEIFKNMEIDSTDDTNVRPVDTSEARRRSNDDNFATYLSLSNYIPDASSYYGPGRNSSRIDEGLYEQPCPNFHNIR